MPPARLGLVYSHTGIRRFIDTIGAARTRELFLRRAGSTRARRSRWGLVNEVVEDGRLAEEALELAVEIAANSPLSLAGNKRVIRAVLDAGRRSIPRSSASCSRCARALRSEDFHEGVRAFAEKRPPQWQGR